MAARPRDAATASTHHVPQLVVEGVPLPARGTITHVDVEGSAREVGDISAALAIVSELLAHDVADEPKAFEEARGVQGVLRRERLARALQRVWAGRNAAYAGPRLGVELIGRPAWHARQGAPAGPRVRAARRTHSDDAARAGLEGVCTPSDAERAMRRLVQEAAEVTPALAAAAVPASDEWLSVDGERASHGSVSVDVLPGLGLLLCTGAATAVGRL